jgi:hypothetical protein
MIEIIKRGTKKTCTCDKCGCYFSYEEEDVEKVYNTIGTPWGESRTYKSIVRCPQCESVVNLMATK